MKPVKPLTLLIALSIGLSILLFLVIIVGAQDETLWKYIGTTKNEVTGAEVTFHARDCYRFTDLASEKLPKLAVRNSSLRIIKEMVYEFDCKRRAMRTRIWIMNDGSEEKATDLSWEEVVPTSAGEALLEYACRDRKVNK